MLYPLLAVLGLAVAWANQRSLFWAVGAPITALGASAVLLQWAPLMPMWGEPAAIVQAGGLLAGMGALVAQVLLGAQDPEPEILERAAVVLPAKRTAASQLSRYA